MATPAQAIWSEHRNTEGRTYWFNTNTKQSVWEKPDDLKTPFERALNATPWKAYFAEGKKYYYHSETKETKWEMPDELLLLLEKVEKEEKEKASIAPSTGVNGLPAPPNFAAGGSMQGALVPMGGPNSSSFPGSQSQGLNGATGVVGPHTGALPFQQSGHLPSRPNMSLPDDPVIPHNGFATVEEGEKAFMHLLKKAGVDANWTWDQTMRAIITDPLYKALNNLAEKKAAWQKYTDGLKAKEQEEKDARLAKLRPALRNMLKGNPSVFYYTTFATADKLFAQHPIWQQARIEAERRMIFEEYVAELKERELQESRAQRTRNLSKLVGMFKDLGVDVYTKWRLAYQHLVELDEWRNDSELQTLPNLDILLAFEDYSRVKEREYEEQSRRRNVEKTRKERKAREGFKALLRELLEAGHIKAKTKWKEIYPYVAEDERYINILGVPGSNPLELFWDTVDGLDQIFDSKVAAVEDAIRKHNAGRMEGVMFTITPNTRLEELKAVAQEDESLGAEDLNQVLSFMQEESSRRLAEEKRRMERRQRHLQDDLRYALKKLPEPMDLSAPYEAAVPLMENLPEYKALDDEEGRRAAFAKFIKRQKERLRDAGSDDGSANGRKRKEPVRDHREPDRDRSRERHDRDRDSRHHHRSHDDHERRPSREYPRDRDRDRDRDREHRDREKDRGDRGEYRSSRSHRDHDYDHDSRRRERRRSERERSGTRSAKDEDERPEKRPRLEADAEVDADGDVNIERAETPEEGEI